MRSAKITFKSLSHETCLVLGSLSETLGKRPSEFFEWNSEEEWQERLFFDIKIISEYKEAESKEMDKLKRRR